MVNLGGEGSDGVGGAPGGGGGGGGGARAAEALERTLMEKEALQNAVLYKVGFPSRMSRQRVHPLDPLFCSLASPKPLQFE
jgi:hypothetical protein